MNIYTHHFHKLSLSSSVHARHGQCPLLKNGVLDWLYAINIPALLLQARSFTNNEYLGQVEISVSVGNLHNYITQLPNLLL